MFGSYLWFCRVLFCCTRTMGAIGTRPSLRPHHHERASCMQSPGATVPRGCWSASAVWQVQRDGKRRRRYDGGALPLPLAGEV